MKTQIHPYTLQKLVIIFKVTHITYITHIAYITHTVKLIFKVYKRFAGIHRVYVPKKTINQLYFLTLGIF